jgi:hypothetical protein
VIKDYNGMIITDSTGKVNILNSYYAPVFFFCANNVPKIKIANSGETCIINTTLLEKG